MRIGSDFVQEVTAEEFLEVYRHSSDFIGCYVLFNASKDMYYIGQSHTVLRRVACHFKGGKSCCADVYADYKYGDIFTVQVLPLEGSGYDTLDEMERVLIVKYRAVSEGYNKVYGIMRRRMYRET